MKTEIKKTKKGVNKMSKIKKPTKKQIMVTLYLGAMVMLVALGVYGTLKYQSFINSVKEQGVSEYKAKDCKKYEKDGSKWLECDI